MADNESQDPGSASGGAAVPGEEYRSSASVRTALISGNTFHARAIQYVDVDGEAIFEGDIVLGRTEQIERDSDQMKAELRGEVAAGVIITGNQFRWPNCVVPFDIDSTLPNQARVTDAIHHWETNTNFRFTLRTAANAAQFPDWVTFRPSSGCSSSVGRRGLQQFVNLGTNCTTGNAIHEIGHTVGIWHEQSREDRDAFVTIVFAKIMPGFEHNFDQHITDGDDVGPYDYGSIMHYPRTAFSVDGSDTIVPTNASAQIGQRTALSPGDIATANAFCPGKAPFETIKELHPETIKEVSPETVKERSPETIKERFPETIKEVGPETVKEISPETIKERFPETIKEVSPETGKERFPETVKEVSPETIKERFPETLKEQGEPPGTLVEGIPPGVGPGVSPQVSGAGTLPFAMQTPHLGVGSAPAVGQADTEEALLGQLAALSEALTSLEANQGVLLEQYQQIAALLEQYGWQ